MQIRRDVRCLYAGSSEEVTYADIKLAGHTYRVWTTAMTRSKMSVARLGCGCGDREGGLKGHTFACLSGLG